MIDVHDYQSYLTQNSDFLELLKANCRIIYDRFEDVFLVMDFIKERVRKYEKVEEEFEVIFEVGFTYFHQQLEELKNIYEIYFKNDIAGFKKYQTLVNYYLFLSDLAESLKEKSLYKEEAKEAISGLYGEIEDIFSEKKDFDQEIFQKFNFILEGIAPVGTLTTQEIYVMIREEIEVWD